MRVPVAPDDRDGRRADARDQIEAGPPARHRVVRALETHERPRRHRAERRRLGDKRHRQRPEARAAPPRSGRRSSAPVRVARRLETRIQLREQRVIDRRERRRTRNRHERLPADGLAARFDAALVVAFARSTETWLDQVVRGERRKPRGQRPRAADQDPPHRRRADCRGYVPALDMWRRPQQRSVWHRWAACTGT